MAKAIVALFDDYDGSMPCQCRSPHCRGVITGRDWQRRDLQRKYRGYFSWYLERRIGPTASLASASALVSLQG